MPTTDLLRGPRLRLTPLTSDDLPEVAGWYSDSEFARMYDARPAAPRTVASLHSWLDGYASTSDGFVFAIRPHASDLLLGFSEIESVLWPHRTAWLTLAIGAASQRGQGYGREALGLVLRFAFHELNLHRLQLSVFSYNQAAIRLYERLGFVREGAYREYIERDGQRYDMYLYGLLRREWELPATAAR